MATSGFEKNSGFGVARFDERVAAERQFTLVVSGLGRSGTTMVAQALTAGGIPMGVGKRSVLQEDMNLAKAIEGGRRGEVRQMVAERNAAHDVWGFKRPLIVKHAWMLGRTLRKPRYVLVFRDPVAVSMRNTISLNREFESALREYFHQSKMLLRFIRWTDKPVLYVSYEKALLNPEAFVAELARFAGIPEDRHADMLAVISPDDERYRKVTSPTFSREGPKA